MVSIAELPKYDAYRDADTLWLSQVPKHWEMKKVFYLFNAKKGGDAAKLTKEYCGLHEGEFPVYSGQTENHGVMGKIDHYEFDYSDQGCLFSTTVGAKAMTVRFLKSKFSLSQNCMIIVGRYPEVLDLKFSYYAFQPMFQYFRNQIPDHMQASFRMEDLYQFKTVLPPKNEQYLIVDFLDKKTTQIDEAIAIKEQQIALLKERKQIIIQKAVTQGLDPNVPMKDSGVDWIGEIPAHWEVENSQWIFKQRKMRARKTDEQLTASQKYGVVPQKEFMETEGRRVTQVEFNAEILKHVEKNDFVISMRSFQGGIEYCPYTGCVSSAYVPLIPEPMVNPEFFKYLLKSRRYIEALQSTSNLVRDGQALRYENFCMVPLPVVPVDEQAEIACYIEKQIEMGDRSIRLMERQIEKLKEYKTTLINSAVTGKIRITPDMVEA